MFRSEMGLTDPIDFRLLDGKGLRGLSSRLEKLGLARWVDLFLYAPSRYWPILSPQAWLERGGEEVWLLQRGRLQREASASSRIWRFRVIPDEQGPEVSLICFRKPYWAGWVGVSVEAFGKCTVRDGAWGPVVIHPTLLRAGGLQADPAYRSIVFGGMVASYAGWTSGTDEWKLRRLLSSLLEHFGSQGAVRAQPWDLLFPGFPSWLEAVKAIHGLGRFSTEDRQALMEGRHASQHRLRLEEALAHRLSLTFAKQAQGGQESPCRLPCVRWPLDSAQSPDSEALDGLELESVFRRALKGLPYRLRPDQSAAFAQILEQLGGPHPMKHLVLGDVGTGKTVVAALAALAVVAQGFQVLVLAPTTVLAWQHHRWLKGFFSHFSVEVHLLTGERKGAAVRERRAALGEDPTRPRVLVATQAACQHTALLPRLALVVIDEPQRFGVLQRANVLLGGGQVSGSPHQLLLSATPIPRTLALALQRYLTLSRLELPPRAPGTERVTRVLLDTQIGPLLERLDSLSLDGRPLKAYWVCPQIQDRDGESIRSVEHRYESLRVRFPNAWVGRLHGRMKSDEKKAVLETFEQAKPAWLVCTTAIEVGIDVPEANLMVVEGSELLGLSQLHQLRGRVGRSGERAYCLFFFPRGIGEVARRRLQCVRNCELGEELAARDLQLRGPGSFLDTPQSGWNRTSGFRFLKPWGDSAWFDQAESMLPEFLSLGPQGSLPLLKLWGFDTACPVIA